MRERSLGRLPVFGETTLEMIRPSWHQRDRLCVPDTLGCSSAGPRSAISPTHAQCYTCVQNIRASLFREAGGCGELGRILCRPTYQRKRSFVDKTFLLLFPKRQNRFLLCCVSSDENAISCPLRWPFIIRNLINTLLLQDHTPLETISSRVSLHWEKMTFMAGCLIKMQ